MNELKILLSVLLLIVSLVSLIRYFSRRITNKGAFRDLLASPPTRQLTPDERVALQPFLTQSVKPFRTYQLRDENVRRLDGEFIVHSLEVQGSKTLHQTLGEVEVILPGEARDAMEAMNRAEVVLTEDRAIVISLNDRYHVLKRAEHPTMAAASTAAVKPEHTPPRQTGTREETDAEVAARTRGRLGWLPALGLILASVLFLLAGHDVIPPSMLGGSAMIAGLALLCFWMARRNAKKQPVDLFAGSLSIVKLQNRANPQLVDDQVFLGGTRPLPLPDNWWATARKLEGREVTVAMRAADGSLLSLGDSLSMDAEERRRPTRCWRLPLLTVFLGTALFIAGWVADDQIGRDLLHAKAGLVGQERVVEGQPDALIAHPAKAGTLVRFRGEGRCQILPETGGDPGAIRCSRFRWAGAVPSVGPVVPSPQALAFTEGTLLTLKENPMAGLALAMARARAGQGGFDLDLPTRRASVYSLLGLTALVNAINQACPPSVDTYVCTNLKDTLTSKVDIDGLEASAKWRDLVKIAIDGSLAQNGDQGLILKDSVESIAENLRTIGQTLHAKAYRTAFDALLLSQRGGVEIAIHTNDSPADDVPLDATANRGNQFPSPPLVGDVKNWPKQWAAYQALTTPDALRPFAIQGLVTDLQSLDSGLQLTIDQTRRADNYRPAAYRLLPILVGLLLALSSGLSLLSLHRQRRRERPIPG